MRPNELLSPTEIALLRRRSNLVGALLVLHAWALILGAMALFALWPNPLSFLLAVMVIGGRQLGIAIQMHDAAHGLLFANRRLNDWIGQWLCAYPVGTDLNLYRPYHLTHHRLTQQAGDPDLALSSPFPITRASLRRKILRDITGQTGFQRRRAQWRDAWGPADLPARQRIARLRTKLGGAFLVNVILAGALAAVGYWWLFPLLWLLPMLTWYQLISRIRNIAEHAVVPDNDDPLRNTRTTMAGPLTRLFLAPYRVNYHLEHHLLLFVPCWRLPAAHRLLLAKEFGSRMELRRSYREVLRLATTALADHPKSGGQAAAQFI
jgi:fatty acid desaturase